MSLKEERTAVNGLPFGDRHGRAGGGEGGHHQQGSTWHGSRVRSWQRP